MTDTGWKSPLSVAQDDRKSINNGHSCYSFRDLNDIKRNDTHHAYIPTSGGIDSLRASPMVYAYNYNFNVPANATIKKVYVLPIFQQSNGAGYGNVTKIKTIKLKTGSSTTDGGTGNNLANNSFIEQFKVPIKSWTSESSFKKGSEYVLCGGKDVWNVELTPSVVNSTNFGFVFQVVGTKLKKWVNPYIAKMLMKVEYDTSGQSDSSNKKSTTSVEFRYNKNKFEFDEKNNYISKTTVELDITKPNEAKTIDIVFKHKGSERESPVIVLESNGLLIGDNKQKTYTVPSLHFSNDAAEKEYSQSFKIYPNILNGEQYLIIKIDVSNLSKESAGSKNANRIIKFNVKGEIFSSFSSEDVKKYVERGQFCKVMGCLFKNNKATYEKNNVKYGRGGAMFIYTESFQYKASGKDSNSYEGNVAGVSANNLCWNDESY